MPFYQRPSPYELKRVSAFGKDKKPYSGEGIVSYLVLELNNENVSRPLSRKSITLIVNGGLRKAESKVKTLLHVQGIEVPGNLRELIRDYKQQ